MRFLSRLILALALGLVLSGCLFDRPLTNGPTESINTWLLGVWEAKDDKGQAVRAMDTPISGDRYDVQVSLSGKKPHEIRRYRFEMWPSRVGPTLFLTLRCLESPGDVPTGGHVFIQSQLLSQNTIKTYAFKLDADPSASSYELRKEIRLKLKELSLYEGAQSAVWNRTEEVIWSADGRDPAFKPLRNPTP
jgi:hypothetical protein